MKIMRMVGWIRGLRRKGKKRKGVGGRGGGAEVGGGEEGRVEVEGEGLK